MFTHDKTSYLHFIAFFLSDTVHTVQEIPFNGTANMNIKYKYHICVFAIHVQLSIKWYHQRKTLFYSRAVCGFAELVILRLVYNGRNGVFFHHKNACSNGSSVKLHEGSRQKLFTGNM